MTHVTGVNEFIRAVGPGSAELSLMLLSDARLPTGAHTQSAGLEPAVNAGLSAEDVPRYITARLRTVTAVEAGAAVVARHVALGLDGPTVDTGNGATVATSHGATVDTSHGPSAEPEAGIGTSLEAVDRAWRARTMSPALRETSALLGRGYQRLVSRLWPTHPGVVALRGMRSPCRAVVLGVAAACTGLTASQLARLIGYDEAQTIAAAALKVRPLDPVDATAWVIGAQNEIEAMTTIVADLRSRDEIPAFGAPLIEQWAEIHSATTQRLFRA